MKTVFAALVLNPFRAAGKWYNKTKGHTGVDLNFTAEDLPSPITGHIVKFAQQKEMGNTLYLKDVKGNIHVFAHLEKSYLKVGDAIKRGDLCAKTGNTGTATSGPHLHYEIITIQAPYQKDDKIMTRTLFGFTGWNTDPIPYLKDLYSENSIDWHTGNPL